MIELLLTLLILVLVFAVAWWVLTLIPLPPPFTWVAQAVIGIILLIVLIVYLLPLAHVTRLP